MSGTIDTGFCYRSSECYAFGDWLANYRAGFVRRGLLGEIAFVLHEATAVSPAVYVAVAQVALYSGLLIFSYLLLRRQRLLPYAPLIFVPFVFMYHEQTHFRKELLFLTLMAFCVWFLQSANRRQKELMLMTVLATYPLLVLTHEMLLAFLPYLLAAYVLACRNVPARNAAKLLSISLLSALCLVLVMVHGRATDEDTTRILQSLALAGYPVSDDGAINGLASSPSDGFAFVKRYFTPGTCARFVPVAALVALGFLPIRERCRAIARNRTCLLLIGAAFAMTLPLFVIATDWGRFIRIHAVALFLLSLGARPEPGSPWMDAGSDGRVAGARRSRMVFCLLMFVSYISFWRMPFHMQRLTVPLATPHYVSSVRQSWEYVETLPAARPPHDPAEPLYSSGWFPEKTNRGTTWRWTTRRATLTFLNPRTETALTLEYGAMPHLFPDGPQNVTAMVGDQVILSFPADESGRRRLRIPLGRTMLRNEGALVDLRIAVDRTFVPAEVIADSRDQRRLGIMVYQATVEH